MNIVVKNTIKIEKQQTLITDRIINENIELEIENILG